ncbi:Lipase 1 [Candida viswanathii]|uniref:Lipase n=1 Tax=Candida viswanathii TaxID=5486 RepID=A0A367YD77_9ASCO|nr:Lipase 1 [Candida viswanathii]
MKLLLLLLLSITFVHAAVTTLEKPEDDDFYTPPEGYEDAELGEILKIRNTPHRLASMFFPIDVENSWQLLIRSSDSFDNATAIVTTIIQPYNADPSKVLSYQTFEDLANINCSPSYGIQWVASISTVASQIDMTFMVPMLNNGYYIVTPDYEGPKSTFTVGRQSGHGTLDSIRAALHSGNLTGIDEDASVAMWGYSGGSLASGWAASLQPHYAPELEDNLIGVALGGFVTNITATAEATDGKLLAGLVPIALNGLGNEYDDFHEILYSAVRSNGTEELADGLNHCLIGGVIRYAFDDFLTGEDRLFPEDFGLLNDPVVNRTISENNLMNAPEDYVPRIPVFVYHGTLDAVVPIVNVKTTYERWCGWGIESFEFAEDLLNGHISETLVGAPAALTWLEGRFNGVEPVKGCQHTTRLMNFFYPNISQATYEYFSGYYEALAGTPLGEGLNTDNFTLSALLDTLGDLF